MKIPTRQQAEAYLVEAEQLNPGSWIDHSREVALAAQAIANHHPDLDPETAYILGLLHDIGRREGVTDMRHVIDGYNFLLAEGYPYAARASLTHSFPLPEADSGAGKWDCDQEQVDYVQSYLLEIEYSPYDRLIQLCDAICLPSGPVLMEKRLIDVALRHGFNQFTLAKWQSFFLIQNDFEKVIGQSIYNLLPRVVENTFGMQIK
jgi:hypothetical protein